MLHRAERIPGWMTRQELEWVSEQAKNYKSWVEVGCYCGRSLLAVGLSLPPDAVLHSIDHKWGEAIEAGITAYDVHAELRPLQLVTYRMTSFDASKLFADKSVDVVFIDANHLYEGIRKDLAVWLPKAKHLICGHDYSPSWPGVVQAVDELLPDRKILGSIWSKKL